MKLHGKVPVEPLDEERLTNIERKLVVQVSELSQQPLRAPRRMLAFAAVALAVVVAAFVGWRLRGDGAVVPASEPEQLVMKDGALHLGDADIVGKDFTVTRSAGRVVVTMQKAGKLDLRVDHKPERLFVVNAGDVAVEDVGTRFSVDWDGGRRVDVRVTEGEVKVKRGGKDFPITAGNAWGIDIGPVTIVKLDETRAAAATVAAATTEPAQPDAPTVVAIAPTAQGSTGGNGGSVGSTQGSAQGSGAKPRKIGGPNTRKALEESGLVPLVEPADKDPRKAIDEYVRRAVPMRENEDKAKLYQSIAVMHLRTKNYGGASRFIEGILHARNAPDGSYTEWEAYKRALWLDVKIKCLRSKAFDDACRIAAERYLVKFPNGSEAGIAQQLLHEL